MCPWLRLRLNIRAVSGMHPLSFRVEREGHALPGKASRCSIFLFVSFRYSLMRIPLLCHLSCCYSCKESLQPLLSVRQMAWFQYRTAGVRCLPAAYDV